MEVYKLLRVTAEIDVEIKRLGCLDGAIRWYLKFTYQLSVSITLSYLPNFTIYCTKYLYLKNQGFKKQ